ncbi:MAG: PTS sugar transporter subunit IIC [Oscillospiraceae bacterium]
MRELLLLVEKKVVLPLEKISRQRHLVAVREGLMAVFPLSLIGTLFLLITTLPLPETWAVRQFIVAHENIILVPYRMTLVLIALYMVVSVGASLAKYYKYNSVSGSLVALAAFLMTQIPVHPSAMVPETFLQQATSFGLDTSWMSGLEDIGWVMPQALMGGTAVYVGALSAIMGVEILHLCNWAYERHAHKKRNKPQFWAVSQIPASMIQTVQTITPIFLVVVLMFLIRDVLGFDLLNVSIAFFAKLIGSVSTLPGAMGYVLIMTLLGFFGVIGFSVANSAASIAWLSLLLSNRIAHIAGEALPNVAPLPFFNFFIWIGGVGSTLAIVLLLCFSKSRYLKRLGQSCLLPSLFNISTPVIYGLPVILNPYMLIPFVLGPMASTLISYLCLQLNLVGRPYSNPSGSFPFAVGAFFATGDWKAILLCVFNLALSVAIYYPFFRMYEKKLLAEGADKAAWEALDKDEATMTTVD